ncbi:CBS-domain-containing protein [Alternaria alternata]|nr:CBS-domain-containing protein [Alternaria alternata]
MSMWLSMASRAAYVVALRHLRAAGAEPRAARFALGNVRGMSLESWSWNSRWAVGELLGLVAVRGLGRPPHGTSMRHGVGLRTKLLVKKQFAGRWGKGKSDVDVVARVRKTTRGSKRRGQTATPSLT